MENSGGVAIEQRKPATLIIVIVLVALVLLFLITKWFTMTPNAEKLLAPEEFVQGINQDMILASDANVLNFYTNEEINGQSSTLIYSTELPEGDLLGMYTLYLASHGWLLNQSQVPVIDGYAILKKNVSATLSSKKILVSVISVGTTTNNVSIYVLNSRI